MIKFNLFINISISFSGFFRRMAVVGDRLSPFVSLGCIIMAFLTLLANWAYVTQSYKKKKNNNKISINNNNI